MALNVTRNWLVITREIFDLPGVLKAAKWFDAVNWKVSSFFKSLMFKNQAQLPSHLWRTC